VYKDDHPNIFKLIKETDDLSQLEEASFTAYGIILEKELPPIQLERYRLYHTICSDLFTIYIYFVADF